MSETNEQHRVSVSCKIPVDWNEDLDTACLASGQTKSQLLADLVADFLGKGKPESRQKAAKRLMNLATLAIDF